MILQCANRVISHDFTRTVYRGHTLVYKVPRYSIGWWIIPKWNRRNNFWFWGLDLWSVNGCSLIFVIYSILRGRIGALSLLPKYLNLLICLISPLIVSAFEINKEISPSWISNFLTYDTAWLILYESYYISTILISAIKSFNRPKTSNKCNQNGVRVIS